MVADRHPGSSWAARGRFAAILALAVAGASGCGGSKGSDGATGPAGAGGSAGRPGLAAGQTPGLTAKISVSTPANGAYFAAGERIVFTIVLEDGSGYPVSPSTLSQARFMIAGPKDPLSAVTAVGLLGASTDRSAPVHHYLDLRDATTAGLVISGNTLTFTTNQISTEPAGTYIAGLWAASTLFPIDQSFPTREVQIGGATVQASVVDGTKCGACHLGPMSGKFYFHHIDPVSWSPAGNWSIDSAPVNSCKLCHNSAGYAAYCNDRTQVLSCPTASKVSDPIVRRVHGVHRGTGLRNPFDTDPMTGDFADYVDVKFPADVRRCTKCHLDDRWSSTPSRLACGTCHDDVDFATGNIVPVRVLGNVSGAACTSDLACVSTFGTGATCNTSTGSCERTRHGGGAQTTDTNCAACHDAIAVTGSHRIPSPSFQYTIGLSMTAPANGSYYVNEAPVVSVTVTPVGGSTAIDPATITESAFPRAFLYVSGPRARTMPVLTTAAQGTTAIRAATLTGVAPFNLTTATDVQLAVDGGATLTIPVSAGTFATLSAATAAEVAAWLNANAGFQAAATAAVSSGRVAIKSKSRGAPSSVQVLASTGATALGLVVGTYVPVETAPYADNDFRVRLDPFDADPRVTRTATKIDYRLDGVTGLAPGTYTVWAEAGTAAPMSWGVLKFQVGTATVEPQVATNCADCHEDTRRHENFFAVTFDPDICKSCHDYERQLPGKLGWGVAVNNGFGAAPLSRRVHGVHFGRYLTKPQEIVPFWLENLSKVIFPQDVRNCTKCHATNDVWKNKPSRLACLACHDTDADIAHGTLMTYDPTPADPWSGDEAESCAVCHEAGKDFGVDKVHSIANPYVPPYPR